MLYYTTRLIRVCVETMFLFPFLYVAFIRVRPFSFRDSFIRDYVEFPSFIRLTFLLTFIRVYMEIFRDFVDCSCLVFIEVNVVQVALVV